MSTFSFNKIFVLESLLPNEFQTGTELERRINSWAPSQGINCQVVTFQIHSMQDWEVAWNGIYTSITQMGNNPIIHLEMHGNETQVGIDKGKNGSISLIDVFKKVQKANELSHNNTFLSLAVCEGLNVIRSLGVYEPMPFCGVMGSEETLGNQELLENYTIFYKTFLKTLNLDAADAAMKASGIEAGKYKLVKPEQVFMNAYLGYLETYKTDEQIVDKAKKAACDAGIVFKDDDEKNRFVRDYRCSLLLTENEEYQRAVNKFFMFDHYPEIRSRFSISKNIYDFKQYAIKTGNEWLKQKRKLTDDDVKGLSIRILHEVDEFCKINNINYSLAYGTMIGAIRHKGFIPWDDDIDIMMLRPDYEKFISCFNQYKPDIFSVASVETDPTFHYPMAKIICNSTINDELGFTGCGFAIDLFPFDKLPVNNDELKSVLKYKKRSWDLFALKTMKWNNNRSVLRNLVIYCSKALVSFIPNFNIHKRIMRIVAKYASLEGDYLIGCLYTPYGSRDIMSKEIFEETIQVPFEQSQFSCIKEYDQYLTNVYGNYMKFPPIEQQVTHHDNIAWWK